MAVTESFLASCRTSIELHPEFTAFRTAYTAFDTAPRAQKGAYWRLAFDDAQTGLSPAYRLKKVIRDVIAATADTTVSRTEREEAYRTLSSQYVPAVTEPKERAEEVAELHRLILEDLGT